jgi:hypothetical protein
MTKQTTSEKVKAESPATKPELTDEQLSAIAGGVVSMPPVSAGGGGTTPPSKYPPPPGSGANG